MTAWGFTLPPQVLYPAAELQAAVAAVMRPVQDVTWFAAQGPSPLLSGPGRW